MSIEFVGHVFPHEFSETIAARKYATIDAFHPGRIALHTITGGDDADQARDGDWLDYEPYADAVGYGDVISLVHERALVAA